MSRNCQIIGLPIQSGTYVNGCIMGPDAFRTAGLSETLQSLGHTVEDAGNIQPVQTSVANHPNTAIHDLTETVGWSIALEQAAYCAMKKGKFPIFLGGDHSLSIGSVPGVTRAARDSGRPQFVLWLDAHPDYHTLNSTSSGNLHAEPIEEEYKEQTTQMTSNLLGSAKPNPDDAAAAQEHGARGSSALNRSGADARADYEGEEEDLVCGRFPHLNFCGCDIPCLIALAEIKLIEVFDGIFMGPMQSAYKTKDLVNAGVTHVLNVSCKEYTKRSKYLTYLDIHIYDAHNEDAKRHFRITNRFIDEARQKGKVLVHCVAGKSRSPTFILAYLIGKQRIRLKDGIHMLRQFVPEVEPNEAFMTQLSEYDLEILSKF